MTTKWLDTCSSEINFYLKKSLVGGNRCRATQKKPIINKFLLPADQLHTHTATLRLSSGIDNGHCFRSSGNSAWMICCKLQHVDGLCRCYIRHPPHAKGNVEWGISLRSSCLTRWFHAHHWRYRACLRQGRGLGICDHQITNYLG